jgi:hypothetical protein
MPIHDWTGVESGIFHDFHQGWTIEIRNTLNSGLLPPGYVAMIEYRESEARPDETDAEHYARKANRIIVRYQLGRVVAMIVVVCPGNKDSDSGRRLFVSQVVKMLRWGVRLLLIDPFPPTRDPDGVLSSIWDELVGEPFDPRPPDKPLTAAAYDIGTGLTAYVEPLAVGDRLPEMPLFLEPGYYVPTPLEATYQASWNVLPGVIRDMVEP